MDSFKCLGVTLDNNLNFNQLTTDIHRRCQQRLYTIRTLRSFSVEPNHLLFLYCSIIKPTIMYCATCYFTMLPVTNTNKLLKIPLSFVGPPAVRGLRG